MDYGANTDINAATRCILRAHNAPPRTPAAFTALPRPPAGFKGAAKGREGRGERRGEGKGRRGAEKEVKGTEALGGSWNRAGDWLRPVPT